MDVYLAARFSRKDELLGYRDHLLDRGIGVTSRWLQGGHEFSEVPVHEILDDVNAGFANEDLEDILGSDLRVCFTEASGAGRPRGGRHFEAGYAYAYEIPLLIVGPRENVFYCLPCVRHAADWPTALRQIVQHRDDLR